ncbi:MAG: sugar phosphate isomerase/epimerase [Armatimonadetes bacterium]|nr:sugar phosphate isomerase/epimerase [Armatimonadota bacterium]
MAIRMGCFTRPWNGYELEDWLAGTAAAGYELAGTMNLNKAPVISVGMSADEVKAVRERIETAGLKPSTVLGSFPLEGDRDESVAELRALIDNIALLGAEFLLHCGCQPGPAAERFYDVYAECCDYARERGVMLTLKPHGGITNTGADLLYALETIAHENFGIYYDPGNIVHYKGLDPVHELLPIAEHVVAMCVKDSEGEMVGVNILPGTGVVDFAGVFEVLLGAGFDGHLVVECLGGETLDEVNENARRTREFLEGFIT